ncbi:M57 family metalloprotease, partial [Aquimarina sp. RZ0]|uniref:M57 family metalloprotease n=1 Tax=Aquimarina sp. RZ0 TaxID=2607730 RepID=UPI0011F0F4D9
TLSTVPAGISQKLINLGVNPTNAERYEQKTSDGKVTQGWLSHDIFITDEQLHAMDADISKAFYNTRVSVNGTRTITIVPSGSSFNNNVNNIIGILGGVVNDFNSLGLRLRFNVGETTPPNTAADFGPNNIVIQSNGTSGCSARFPSNGNPGSFITFDSNGSFQVLRTALFHEIMHALGLRHSDFRTGSSCENVRPASVGDENVSAPNLQSNFIPGTANDGNFTNSVMSRCFIGNFNLTEEDVRALQGLYGF